MFLNIVTPCCRPENLHTIANTINIPEKNYRWIIVFDMDNFPDLKYIPKKCEYYLHRNENSVAGHSQRNFALDLIKEGHVYQNDDDTAIHPELWENIKDLTNKDFISFAQMDGDLKCVRLIGNEIKLNKIDNHNFIVSRELIGNIKFKIDRYDADGLFAMDCIKNSKKTIYIPKILSIYNWLKVQNAFS
jgi:hypothetical protein